jgi:hypothetical protein
MLLQAFIVLNGVTGFAVFADTPTTLKEARADREEYSPYLNDTYPDDVFFADTHLRNSHSTGAGLLGNRIGQEEAYRFNQCVSSIG